MGYPGDQGKPGGWPPGQPPSAPYGPAPERPEEAPPGAPSWGDHPWEGGPRQARASAAGGPSGTQAIAPPFGQAPDGPGGPGAPGDTQIYDSGHGQGFGQGYGPESGQAPGPGPNGEFAEFGPGPGGPDGPEPPDGPAGQEAPRQRRPHLALTIGGAAAAGLLLVGGGFAVSSMLKGDGDAEPATASATPTKTTASPTPSPTVPSLQPVKLKSRTTDPTPLTLEEIFGKRSFKASGMKYSRVAWNHKSSCTSTVTGTKLTSVLRKGDCSQVLRATYVRSDGALIGSVGVFNLTTETYAKSAVKAASAKSAALRPLTGPGITKKIGKGEALGTAEARGHYLVITWVQRPDGKKIPESSYKAVTTFGRQVIKNSGLSFALAYRETEGKPYGN
ncbi:hypothetical protein Acsp04_25200 [Actinomadura sp. NBRC 104425]|uniref:hypothetical protein n=1 Tax=Actinomadura sp. NBRC 104425 TaxID=3032204 RepID=UPI0024A29F95|nr:hypothetical protein [Actinomadura sp. NBRC 104425]GLZ12285.1 hypothetical protein Acsp04_25200 [Actinomadura sp. NBRC 104425]